MTKPNTLHEPRTVLSEILQMACERFGGGDGNDGTFSAANFSIAHANRLGGGTLDGNVVSLLLAGRTDIEPQPGGLHYRWLGFKPKTAAASERVRDAKRDVVEVPAELVRELKNWASKHSTNVTEYAQEAQALVEKIPAPPELDVVEECAKAYWSAISDENKGNKGPWDVIGGRWKAEYCKCMRAALRRYREIRELGPDLALNDSSAAPEEKRQ